MLPPNPLGGQALGLSARELAIKALMAGLRGKRRDGKYVEIAACWSESSMSDVAVGLTDQTLVGLILPLGGRPSQFCQR